MRYGRLAYFAATLAVIGVLVACGSGTNYTYIPTDSSEGRVAGRVLDQDAMPVAGVLVSAAPASLTSPASVTTGDDGRYELRAPAGSVTLTVSGTTIQNVTATVTVTANQTTAAPDITVTPAP